MDGIFVVAVGASSSFSYNMRGYFTIKIFSIIMPILGQREIVAFSFNPFRVLNVDREVAGFYSFGVISFLAISLGYYPHFMDALTIFPSKCGRTSINMSIFSI